MQTISNVADMLNWCCYVTLSLLFLLLKIKSALKILSVLICHWDYQCEYFYSLNVHYKFGCYLHCFNKSQWISVVMQQVFHIIWNNWNIFHEGKNSEFPALVDAVWLKTEGLSLCLQVWWTPEWCLCLCVLRLQTGRRTSWASSAGWWLNSLEERRVAGRRSPMSWGDQWLM